MRTPELTVIVPFKNEEGNLVGLHSEIIQVLSREKLDSEIVYVDDGSTDKSREVMIAVLRKKAPARVRIKLLVLRRNFGQTAAMQAGIDYSSGRLITFLDADGQNDPADIPRFLAKLSPETDLVVGWRKNRRDDFLRSFASKLANWIIRVVFGVPIHDAGCSLKLFRRELINGIRIYGETHRILTAIIYWRGARLTEIPVHHRPRISGKSKYGYSRVIKLIVDLTTAKFLSSYATRPAYVFGAVGLLSILVSTIMMTVVAYQKLFQGIYVFRQPLFIVASFAGMIGIQFLLMGLLAELSVRTYFESQGKTTYEVKSVVG